jgi:hypothetical protein
MEGFGSALRRIVLAFILVAASVARAEDTGQQPPDLTLGNFFSAGWEESWTKRPHANRAPDMALLRVQTNFLEREFRLNYLFEDEINSRSRKSLSEVEGLIAYGLNRRFMIEVITGYDDFAARNGPNAQGPAGAVAGRVQLVDTAESSYSFNVRVSSPNRGTGERQTKFSYGLAGFEDLTRRLGLYRVGLYYDVLFDSLAGPGEPGARRNDISYDVSVAKTLTEPDTALIGDFTLFLETFALSALDGGDPGHTMLSFTPGARFNLGGHNWLMGGVDIPVNLAPKPFDAIYRMTYIKNF